MSRGDDPHRGCVADAREDARAAADALARHPAVDPGIDLLAPAEDPFDAWTLDVIVHVGRETDADGWEPRHQDTARCHGLTIQRVADKTPAAKRVLLTL